MQREKVDEGEYIPVESARVQLGISPREMLMLLEAKALRYRKDPYNDSIRWVSAEDVRDAVEHLARFRQEEKERRHQLFGASTEEESQTEARETLLFTFSQGDLMLLLWASVSYFDAERDIYFRAFDERGSFDKSLQVAIRLHGKLERETKAGRSISEIVEEIYEQKPDDIARSEVFQYLMNKTKRERKPS